MAVRNGVKAVTAVVLACAASLGSAASWVPEKPVEIVIPSGPGSGTDAIGRYIQSILVNRKLVAVPVLGINKSGGGGGIGLNYLNQSAGNGHALYVTSPTLLTSFLTGTTSVGPADVTPVAQLLNEYVAITVAPGSRIRDARMLMEMLLKDPQAVSIGFATALGNANHIAIAAAYKAAGGDPKRLKMVVFKSGGEGVTATMGGHVEVNVIGAGAVIPHLQAGKLRALAVTSPQRLTGALATVPTFIEQGVNSTSGQWRGLVGPRGMTADQTRYWDETLARLTATPEWQQVLEQNRWEAMFMRSAETRTFLAAEFTELKSLLEALGLTR